MIRVLIIAQIVWRETIRRKDLYVLFILLLSFLLVLMTLNIFGLRSMTGYIKETGLLMAWIFAWILAVGGGARQLPQEERNGTIFPLLAKPVKRSELIIGKWLGVWGVTGAATACFYIILAVIVAARAGRFSPVLMLEAWMLHFCFIGILSAFVILFSTRMNSDAAATAAAVLSVASFLFLPQIPHLAGIASGWRREVLLVVYYALPHLELFDLRQRVIHNWDPVGPASFLMIVLYGLLTAAVFILLAWLAYRRKKFSRDVI
ncbi:MAG: ABC transporter permease subunit [Kiritimatiellae bacterium]|nr:ABC transporter permease subunit [Kiritimatiellia bacterium]